MAAKPWEYLIYGCDSCSADDGATFKCVVLDAIGLSGWQLMNTVASPPPVLPRKIHDSGQLTRHYFGREK